MLSKIYKIAYLKKYIPEPFFSIIKFIYHYLRYLNIIKVDYKIKKIISFNNNNFHSNNYFLNNIKKSKIYLEYGSGNSTLFLESKKKLVFSVEADRNFYLYLNNKIHSKKIFLYYSFIGITEYGSYPIFFYFAKFLFRKNYINYAKNILDQIEKKKTYPDLVLIDGRFRVLCAIYLYLFIKKNYIKFKKKPLVIFDDFFIRDYYHHVNKFFYIKKVKNFGVLYKIKKNVKNIEYYIKKYSYDPR